LVEPNINWAEVERQFNALMANPVARAEFLKWRSNPVIDAMLEMRAKKAEMITMKICDFMSHDPFISKHDPIDYIVALMAAILMVVEASTKTREDFGMSRLSKSAEIFLTRIMIQTLGNKLKEMETEMTK
jgi:hypothetical protein